MFSGSADVLPGRGGVPLDPEGEERRHDEHKAGGEDGGVVEPLVPGEVEPHLSWQGQGWEKV